MDPPVKKAKEYGSQDIFLVRKQLIKEFAVRNYVTQDKWELVISWSVTTSPTTVHHI